MSTVMVVDAIGVIGLVIIVKSPIRKTILGSVNVVGTLVRWSYTEARNYLGAAVVISYKNTFKFKNLLYLI